MNDEFMRFVYRRHPKLIQFILRILMGNKKLTVGKTQIETQKDINNLFGLKSVRLDVYVETKSDITNLEIQRSLSGASRGRLMYHAAAILFDHSKTGAQFFFLDKKIHVIFICEEYPYDKNEQKCTFKVTSEEHPEVEWGLDFVFVNAKCRDGSVLAMLMEDLCSPDPDKMHFKEIADVVRSYKNPKLYEKAVKGGENMQDFLKKWYQWEVTEKVEEAVQEEKKKTQAAVDKQEKAQAALKKEKQKNKETKAALKKEKQEKKEAQEQTKEAQEGQEALKKKLYDLVKDMLHSKLLKPEEIAAKYGLPLSEVMALQSIR